MRSITRITTYAMVASVGLLLCSSAQAAIISLNFSENSGNQIFTGGESIGPLGTNSSNWNLSDNFDAGGSLAAGTLSTLVDNSGNTTGATVEWASSNTWFNGDGTGDDEHRMAVGYLDDGDPVSITFSNIPYPNYRVYGLLASDQGPGPGYTTVDFEVNGTPVFGGTAPAWRGFDEAGGAWVLADGVNRGNYWTAETSGSTLRILGGTRDGSNRGSITAVIIKQSPEPASVLLLCMAGCVGLATSRRK